MSTGIHCILSCDINSSCRDSIPICITKPEASLDIVFLSVNNTEIGVEVLTKRSPLFCLLIASSLVFELCVMEVTNDGLNSRQS